MQHYLFLAAALVALWWLLSGIPAALLLALGGASILGVTWLAARMDRIDGEPQPLRLKPLATLAYFVWLVREIVKSNIDVARIILDPKLPISPTLIRVRSTQRSLLGEVVYANSITLTPGTVSINLRGGTILVHALTREGAAALTDGEMDRRVTAIESSRAIPRARSPAS